ncbi:50S ribosomal protein L32 [candidate division CPR3 bacterium 4484_211]|uniref:Large ribosomal subunit protein bL32 n=1 Tax=candidate division CPR3 bacterium 4484_211 TaxID=1968527 RepID=A0A1W9NZ21_UNCC3|nr:MAG: 50S ribosomal protein L32 [candidate division CPR3 bacterium 4484_211]
MGAVPKKKPSKHRTRTRRSAWRKKQKRELYTECPNCHKLKLPHRVCPHCGFYKGKQAVKTKQEDKT